MSKLYLILITSFIGFILQPLIPDVAHFTLLHT